MSNTLLTPKTIAREALIRLMGNLGIANEVYRDYSNEFQKVGDTVTVRKPAVFVADEFGGTINLQDIGEGSIPVKMDTHLDVSVSVSSKEMTLSIKDFGSQVLDGATLAIAEGVNTKVAKVASQQIPACVGTAGTTPNSLKTGFTNPMMRMDINKVPRSLRRLFFDPVANAELLNLDALVGLDKSGSTAALREASMGNVMSFSTYMDQAIVTHAAGDYTSLADVTVTAVAHDADDYNVSLLTLTSAAGLATTTLKAGDLFEVDGKQYVVIADSATAAAGVVSSVKVHPRFHVDAVGDLGDVSVTFTDVTARAHVSNLAFHEKAIALVTRPLEVPLGKNETNAYAAVEPNTGLSIRVVMDYDINTKKSVISLDALFGAKVVYPTLGCQVLG